jgi:hypothetical protein
VIPGAKLNDDGMIKVNIPASLESVGEPPYLVEDKGHKEEDVIKYDEVVIMEKHDEGQAGTEEAAVQEAVRS